MSRFSVIVPVLGDARLVDDTLASLLRHRPENCQIIVAHDGSYVDRYQLGDEVDSVSTDKRAKYSRLVNEAMTVAKHELIAIFRPGAEVDEHWHLSVAMGFIDQKVGSVSPSIVSQSRPDTVVAAGVGHDFGLNRTIIGSGQKVSRRTFSNANPIGPTNWAAFYRRSVLDTIGPIDETLDQHYVDLDIALSMQTLGLECKLAPECVVTIEREKLLQREAELAHGLSAQRAIRRHTEDTFGRGVYSLLKEIITSPMRPTSFTHAMQRLGAGRFKTTDHDFADRLIAETKLHARAQAIGLTPDVIKGEFNRDDRSATGKKAA